MRKLMCAVAVILCVVLLAANGMAAEQEKLQLKYDDRKALTELVGAAEQVAISNEVVTSFKVGTQTPDDHVLHYDPATGTLYAVGVGTATLTVDGKAYAVTVEPAVLSLIMYTGHSVGHGAEGDARQSVVVEAGQAYSIYDPRYVDFTQTEGYGLGWGSEKRVSNAYQYVSSNGNNHIDAFAPGQNGNRGAGSALAWQWNNLTGEKLWVLNTAVGGSCLNEWMPNASWHSTAYSDYYNTAVKTYNYAQSIIKNEIAAGHYTLGHMGLLYYCGANDKYYPAWSYESIEANYQKLWESFSRDLAMDVDGDGVAESPEYIGLVPYWTPAHRSRLNFDKGAAQVMASGEEYPHLFIASNMLREFMWEENLGNFPAINYTTQSKEVGLPTAVKTPLGSDGKPVTEGFYVTASDGSHPVQVGYNAIGIDTANNLYARLTDADTTITSIELIDEDFNVLTDGLTIKVGEPCPVAPWFEPFYADDLTYSITGDAELIYPLQLLGTAPGSATLTVSQKGRVIKTLAVNVVAGHGTHCVCGGSLTGLAAQKHGTCDGTVQYVPLNSKWLRYCEYTKKDAANEFAQVLTGGNYYLEADYSWSGIIRVAAGETVNICLNGHKLATTGRSFEVHGTLNICDCKGGGQVYSPLTGEAPVAYVRRGGTWNIYGGSYSAVEPKNRDYGGIACVSNEVLFCDHDDSSAGGYINLYGGTLYGSQLKSSDATAGAGGSGGCIMVRSAESKFCMYGGTLSGGSSLYGVSGITSTVYPGGIIGSAGTVELWGGTICNSTDPVAAVYGWGGTVTLKGDVTFRNNANADIYVNNTNASRRLVVEAKQSTSLVVAPKTPSVTDATVLVSREMAENILAPEGYYTQWQDGKLYVTSDEHFNHCVCGGTLKGVAAQKHGSCTAITDWKVLDNKYLKNYTYAKSATENATVQVLSAGNYYLEDDYAWPGRVIYIAPGETVTICLNGHKLTTPTRSFEINGTLNICDCKGGGQVYSKYTNEAPVAYVKCCGTWNVYGGSFSSVAPVNRDYGGVACAGGSRGFCDYTHTQTGGTIRLYDGTFYGCELTCTDGAAAAAGNGGCINVRSGDSYFYMYGGTLSGGKSLQGVSGVTGADYGGGIIGSIGTVELWGGTVEGSTDPIGAISGRSGKVTLKGDVTFRNNAVADIYVTDGKPLSIEAAQSGTVKVAVKTPSATDAAVVADYDKVGCIKTDANHTALYQDGKVYIVKNADLANLHAHCYCGGKAANVGDHVCTTMPVLYTAWTDSTKLPTSGTYYLDVAVQTATQQNITSAELHLCLNGKHSTTTARTFNLKNSSVDLCDCNATEGSITSSYNGGNALVSTAITSKDNNDVQTVTKGSEFNLYGGKLIHSGTAGTASGVDSAAVNIKGYANTNAQGVLRIYGGTIQGGTSTLPGSAVTVQASSNTMGGQLYMYGGTIIGGTASKGAALYIGANTSAQAFIYGGTIRGGTASEMGNAICLEIGKLYVYGGQMDDLALNMSKAGTALNIQGGTIGNVQLVDDFAAADPEVTISGKPIIEKLTRGGSNKPTIAFALEQGASVIFSGETLGQTFGTGSSVAGIGSEEGMVALCEGGKLLWASYITDGALKFAGASVSLYTDIAVNFKVENSILEGNFTDPYVVFDFAGARQQAGLHELKDGYGVFRFRNIGPHMMGETITATLYATKDGKLCQGETRTYSIAQYCYNTLNRYNTDYYGELRTLLVDLLNYGAMAQLYVDSSTPEDKLVTAALTQQQKAWGTPGDTALALQDIRSEAVLEGATVAWKGGGLSLQESVALRLRFAAESTEGLSVKFELDGNTFTVTEFVPVEDKSGEFYVYLRDMNASHMRSAVKATVYRDGQPVSNTLTYSVASYIANHANDTNTQLAQLVKAIIRYGDAAYSYVN